MDDSPLKSVFHSCPLTWQRPRQRQLLSTVNLLHTWPSTCALLMWACVVRWMFCSVEHVHVLRLYLFLINIVSLFSFKHSFICLPVYLSKLCFYVLVRSRKLEWIKQLEKRKAAAFHIWMQRSFVKQSSPYCTTWNLLKCTISSSLIYSKHARHFIITIPKHEHQFSLERESETLIHAEWL